MLTNSIIFVTCVTWAVIYTNNKSLPGLAEFACQFHNKLLWFYILHFFFPYLFQSFSFLMNIGMWDIKEMLKVKIPNSQTYTELLSCDFQFFLSVHTSYCSWMHEVSCSSHLHMCLFWLLLPELKFCQLLLFMVVMWLLVYQQLFWQIIMSLPSPQPLFGEVLLLSYPYTHFPPPIFLPTALVSDTDSLFNIQHNSNLLFYDLFCRSFHSLWNMQC